MNQSVVYAGVDVSKASLDFYCQGHALSVQNTSQGYRALVKWMGQQSHKIQVVCEATGGYEASLVRTLNQEGIPVSVVQPARVRHFAKASGILAKTDTIDAEVIAAFADAIEPSPALPSDASSVAMSELCTFRSQIHEKRVQILHQLEHAQMPFIVKSLKHILKTLDRAIEKLDAQIDELMEDQCLLKTKYQRMIQVQGVGRQTALMVLAYLPEIGSLTKRQVAALAGLAPYNNDSGAYRGSRSIRGGRKKLRTSLYMAALTASRRNPVLSSFYQQLIKRGKKSKVALTALMRKLIIVLNAVVKNPHLSLAT